MRDRLGGNCGAVAEPTCRGHHLCATVYKVCSAERGLLRARCLAVPKLLRAGSIRLMVPSAHVEHSGVIERCGGATFGMSSIGSGMSWKAPAGPSAPGHLGSHAGCTER